MNTNVAVSGTTRLISTRDLIRQLINLSLQERTIDVDREVIAKAIYLAWSRNHIPRGPWETLPDWRKENFYPLADAAIAAMRDGGRS